MPSYEYRPLKHSRGFRLLKIRHGNPSLRSFDPDNVELELVHARVDQAPPYETVSYVWGSSSKNYGIHLARHNMLEVTETMYHMLPFIIKASNTGYLWLDQLCINQADVRERNNQVCMMADIYRMARRTLVWLGDADDASELVVGALRTLGSSFYRFEAKSFGSDEYEKRKNRVLDFSRAQCNKDCPLHGISRAENVDRSTPDCVLQSHGSTRCEFSRARQSIYKVMNRPWFSRCWIVQEALLSKEAYMMIGHDYFAPCDLYTVIKTIDGMPVPNEEEDSIPSIWEEDCGWHAFQWMLYYWGKVNNGQWYLFSMLMTTLRSVYVGGLGNLSDKKAFLGQLIVRGPLKASDKRDFIYGHLGLHDRGRHLIQPNYSLGWQQVFIDATRAFIEETEDLMVLGFCDNLYHVGGQDLPSWVPDWSKRIRMMPLLDLKTKYNGLGFDWSFTASGGLQHIVQPRSVSPKLQVKGVCVDRILVIHPQQFENFGTKPPKHESDYLGLNSMVTEMSMAPWTLPDVSAGRILNVMTMDRHGDAGEMLCSYRSRHESEMSTILYHPRQRRLCQGAEEQSGLGLIPFPAVVGDEIWIINGCPAPVALREKALGEYVVVGVCYFEGLMFGEAVSWTEDETDTIYLV